MPHQSILGLTCFAALSCSAMADETLLPDPHPNNLQMELERGTLPSLLARADDPRDGRLSYLRGSRCADPGDCLAATRQFDIAERDYIKSLSLGSYGPMDLKFTGDRVKLKVKF